MTHTRITITIHDRLDPECVKHEGIRAPWGLRWLFRCDTCRRADRMALAESLPLGLALIAVAWGTWRDQP